MQPNEIQLPEVQNVGSDAPPVSPYAHVNSELSFPSQLFTNPQTGSSPALSEAPQPNRAAEGVSDAPQPDFETLSTSASEFSTVDGGRLKRQNSCDSCGFENDEQYRHEHRTRRRPTLTTVREVYVLSVYPGVEHIEHERRPLIKELSDNVVRCACWSPGLLLSFFCAKLQRKVSLLVGEDIEHEGGRRSRSYRRTLPEPISCFTFALFQTTWSYAFAWRFLLGFLRM